MALTQPVLMIVIDMQLSVMKKYYKCMLGVTLIELILVVALIGIVAAVSVGVINVGRQEEIAQEASIRANMVKVCSALKAYGEAEAGVYLMYPDEGANHNPLDPSATNSDVVVFYLKNWPEGFVYNVASTFYTFTIHMEQSANSGVYWKCTNRWEDIRECTIVSPDGISFACN